MTTSSTDILAINTEKLLSIITPKVAFRVNSQEELVNIVKSSGFLVRWVPSTGYDKDNPMCLKFKYTENIWTYSDEAYWVSQGCTIIPYTHVLNLEHVKTN